MLAKQEIILGIHIDQLLTTLALLNKEGKLLHQSEFKTGAQQSFRFFVHHLKIEVDRLLQTLPDQQKLVGIGIAAPNANPRTGCLEHPADFHWGEETPIQEVVTNLFSVPVTMTGVVNAVDQKKVLMTQEVYDKNQYSN